MPDDQETSIAGVAAGFLYKRKLYPRGHKAMFHNIPNLLYTLEKSLSIARKPAAARNYDKKLTIADFVAPATGILHAYFSMTLLYQ
jgi:hypothetical protein